MKIIFKSTKSILGLRLQQLLRNLHWLIAILIFRELSSRREFYEKPLLQIEKHSISSNPPTRPFVRMYNSAFLSRIHCYFFVTYCNIDLLKLILLVRSLLLYAVVLQINAKNKKKRKCTNNELQLVHFSWWYEKVLPFIGPLLSYKERLVSFHNNPKNT